MPQRPWEVGLVAFEIACRHRFHYEMFALPDHVRVRRAGLLTILLSRPLCLFCHPPCGAV